MDFEFDPLIAFTWSVFAGFLMAMGTGGGGVIAGIGHISLLGIGDPNMIKVVNQLLEITSRIVSVPLYLKQNRVIWPLAVSYGVGAPPGAIAGSWMSTLYLADVSTYRFLFGVLVILIAVRMLYEVTFRRRRRDAGLQGTFEVADRIRHESANGSGAESTAPHLSRVGMLRAEVVCGSEFFEFNPLAAAAGGFGIAFVGSMLGVGGGFLVVPFMASILLFPMFFVAGTALIALLLPLVVSVATYLLLNVSVDWSLVFVEVPGVAIGSMFGPLVNRRIKERDMRIFASTVLICIGIYYLT